MAIDWNVKNAVNRDVERQHLNKILADIRASVDTLNKAVSKPVSDVESTVGKMVENNTENGINVTYNETKKVLDFVITDFTITLTGDVTGSGTVSRLGDVSISTSVDDSIGIEEAPIDGFPYWRVAGEWQYVGVALESLSNMSGTGFTVIRSNDSWITREFEVVAGELVVTNADGNDDNPIFGLADVVDSNTGTLQGVTVDGKGRVTGTTDATITAGAGIDVVNGDAAAGPPTISHEDTSSVANLSSDNSNGVVLQDIALTFDTFGHVQTISVGTVDLDTRYAPATILASTITDGDTTHAPTGNAVFDALAGKEPSIPAGTSGQFWRGDKVFSNTIAGPMGVGFAPSTITYFGANPAFSVIGAGGNSFFASARFDTSAFGPDFALLKSKHATVGSHSVGSDGDNLGSISFLGSNGTTFRPVVRLIATHEGVPSATSMPARLTLATTPAGAIDTTDRWYVRPTGHFEPAADNAYNVGSAALRTKELFSANGTINTSDAREKTVRGPLNAPELSAALELAAAVVIYQWNDALAEKGESARLHCSYTVQSVIAIMQKHGLDPFRYGFVCYDEWPEQQEIVESWPEERDEEDKVTREAGSVLVQEYHPAGDRYSLRPTELQAFVSAGLAAKLATL